MSSKKSPFPTALLHPKHWGTWIIVGILWLLVTCLPYRWLMRLGSKLGWLMEKLMPYRMLIAKTNIQLCFPNRDWETIYRKHIQSLGKGVFEMSMGWLSPTKRIAALANHVGYEVVDEVLAQGRGVIFLGLHSTNLDFGAPLISSRYPTRFMSRAAKNKVLDYIIERGRVRHGLRQIQHDNLREMFICLKKGGCVWYGADQDFGKNATSVFVPFFAMPDAYTLPYYATLARKTNAAVIPVCGVRDDKTGKFIIRYLPEIKVEDMNETQAAIAMNQNIEALMSGYEEQYYWVHRRFKTRPEGQPAVYPLKKREIHHS